MCHNHFREIANLGKYKRPQPTCSFGWGRCCLGDEEEHVLGEAALVEPLVSLAFITAVGGVRLEDVTVSRFQLFEDTAGAAVIGECAEKNRVTAISGIHGAKFAEVSAQQRVGLRF